MIDSRRPTYRIRFCQARSAANHNDLPRGDTEGLSETMPVATSAAVSGLPRFVERSTSLRMTRARASSHSHLVIRSPTHRDRAGSYRVCSLAV